VGTKNPAGSMKLSVLVEERIIVSGHGSNLYQG
jgi:hypothetical protein